MFQSMGYTALIGMISHVFFIVIAWYALQSLRIEGIFKKGKVMESRVLFLLVAIALGHTVSNFFLDILSWSQDMVYFFY